MDALRDVPPGSPLLEIGCGQGALGRRIATRFAYTGVELDVRSAEIARARLEDSPLPARVHHGSFRDLPAGDRFAAVGAFEVLEHLEDDRAALEEWAERVEPGGTLVLSVPAHHHRMGDWDRLVGHYRRYDPGQLSELMTSVGLQDAREAMFGFPLGYLLEPVRNMIGRRRREQESMADRTAASGRALQPGDRFGPATYIGALPFRWLQRPFRKSRLGTGMVAHARVPR